MDDGSKAVELTYTEWLRSTQFAQTYLHQEIEAGLNTVLSEGLRPLSHNRYLSLRLTSSKGAARPFANHDIDRAPRSTLPYPREFSNCSCPAKITTPMTII